MAAISAISLRAANAKGLRALSGAQDFEAALLARFATGDPDAARILSARVGPYVYRVALQMLGDHGAAEDVAQEAMLRLWRIAPKWRAGEAKVTTWLYRVAMNLCIDRRRRRGRPDAALDDIADPADPAPDVVHQLQDKTRAATLQAALSRLPERQRQAVILRHIEELANPEIAEILDISVEAVESLTARGKRALSSELAGRREELGFEDG